jgi:hypothetical protein
MRRLERNVGASHTSPHHLYETSLVPILPARVPKTATLSRVQKGSGCKRSARGRVLPSSVIEV